jgi:hypothetical protein
MKEGVMSFPSERPHKQYQNRSLGGGRRGGGNWLPFKELLSGASKAMAGGAPRLVQIVQITCMRSTQCRIEQCQFDQLEDELKERIA